MKKNILSILIVSGIFIMTTGCIKIGSSDKIYGEKVSTTINAVEEFNTIESTGITDVEYVPGPVSLTLTAPEKIIDNIKIEVRGGVLHVEEDKNFQIKNLSNNQRAKLTVSAPSVGTFISSGIGDMDLKRLNSKEITLVTSGTGDINVQTARCTMMSATSSGTGDIDMSHVSCVVADCTTSGTGDIKLERLVADKLTAFSSGVGDIIVSGECKDANLTSSGMGSINRKGLEIIKTEDEE